MRYFVIFLFAPLFGFGQSLTANIDRFIVEKEFTKAEDTLQTLLKKHPQNLEAIELLGDVYSNQRDWDRAIIQYEKLTELKTQEANYHYKYGGALSMKALSVNKLRALSYLDDMEDAFLKAATLDSKHVNTRWALVRYYLEVPGIIGGSKEKAWLYTEELNGLSLVDGALSKGYYFETVDDFVQAESYYKKAVEVGNTWICNKHLLDLYLKYNKPRQALRAMEAYYRLSTDDKALKVINKLTKDYGLSSKLAGE